MVNIFEKPIKARCTLRITVQLSKVHSRDQQCAIQSQPWRMGGTAGARKALWTSRWLACGCMSVLRFQSKFLSTAAHCALLHQPQQRNFPVISFSKHSKNKQAGPLFMSFTAKEKPLEKKNSVCSRKFCKFSQQCPALHSQPHLPEVAQEFCLQSSTFSYYSPRTYFCLG